MAGGVICWIQPGVIGKEARTDRSLLMDPNPDYDASDELEMSFNWLPWALRGNYLPPAYPRPVPTKLARCSVGRDVG